MSRRPAPARKEPPRPAPRSLRRELVLRAMPACCALTVSIGAIPAASLYEAMRREPLTELCGKMRVATSESLCIAGPECSANEVTLALALATNEAALIAACMPRENPWIPAESLLAEVMD